MFDTSLLQVFPQPMFYSYVSKKLFNYEIKLAISAALESGQNTEFSIDELVAVRSIFNSSGVSPGVTKKVAAL